MTTQWWSDPVVKNTWDGVSSTRAKARVFV